MSQNTRPSRRAHWRDRLQWPITTVFADWHANRGYPKSQLVMVLFRATSLLRGGRSVQRFAYLLLAAVYKLVAEGLLGIEIPPSTSIGDGLRLRHGVATVINPAAVIGENVMVRHSVTIGNRRAADDCPIIEDDVEIGAGAVIVGRVRIGRGARIGPNAVITFDVPPDGVAVAPRSITLQKLRP